MSFVLVATVMLSHGPLPTYQETCVVELASQVHEMALTEYRKFPVARALTLSWAAVHAGRKYDIDPMLLLAISWWESRWKPGAKGDGGRSYGAFQMQRSALKATGLGWEHDRLLNVYLSFWAGAAFLDRLRSKWPGHELPVYGAGMAGRRMDNTRGGRWKLRRAAEMRREHQCDGGVTP